MKYIYQYWHHVPIFVNNNYTFITDLFVELNTFAQISVLHAAVQYSHTRREIKALEQYHHMDFASNEYSNRFHKKYNVIMTHKEFVQK